MKDCGNCKTICNGTNVQFCTKHEHVEWQKYDQWTLCIPGKCDIDIESYRPGAKVFAYGLQSFKTSEDENCYASTFISSTRNLNDFFSNSNLRLKWINNHTLEGINPEDLNGKLIDTDCEDRHNFACMFRIEINQTNGVSSNFYGLEDERLHGGRYISLESSQIRICPRETPNAVNIDGMTRCCKLDKYCASQISQKENISSCCNLLTSDQDCMSSFCVDCKFNSLLTFVS